MFHAPNVLKLVASLTSVQNAMALRLSFVFFCNNCKDWKNEFTTSTKKCKSIDINYKTVYAMRRCGKGYQGLRTFLAIINHPPPMTEKNYRNISHSFTEAARAVALKSMNDVAEDIRCNNDDMALCFYVICFYFITTKSV